MKKWVAALLVAFILLGLGVAVAVGGSQTDPLISRSYIENVYIPGLVKLLQKRANDGTQDAYTAAVNKLDRLGEADVLQAEAVEGGTYAPQTVEEGDLLTLKMGASMVFYGGTCSVMAGTLADVTSGETIAAGANLQRGHRYIATSEETAKLKMGASGSLGYQGLAEVLKRDEIPMSFTDVQETDWFYKSIRYVYEAGYFSGTSATTFAPNSPMTRAMLATVLHRFSGGEKPEGDSPFADVPDGQWYSEGVLWASAHGVVNGMGDGLYMPDRNITREQMVTMLYRYMRDYEKGDVSAAGDLTVFPDSGMISDWAQEAMTWAVGVGVINGRNNGQLDPVGTASRAEVATVLHRFAGLLDVG